MAGSSEAVVHKRLDLTAVIRLIIPANSFISCYFSTSGLII
jgi:hypothetical protein